MLVISFAVFLMTAVSTAASEVCYFPDKTTTSQDVPCNGESGQASSCCPSDSYCMSNGLCMKGGILSRATCTDQTWQSAACSSICLQTNLSQSISITPCGDNSFTCGINTTACTTNENMFTLQSPLTLVLTANQTAELTGGGSAATSEASPISTAVTTTSVIVDGQRLYSGSIIIAIGLGLGFPLALALASCFVLIRTLRSRNANAMYKPPDHPPVPIIPRAMSPHPSLSTLGRSPTIRTVHSFNTLSETHTPAVPRSFLDRYVAQKPRDGEKPEEIYEMDNGKVVYELGSHYSADFSHMAELNGSQPDLAWLARNQK